MQRNIRPAIVAVCVVVLILAVAGALFAVRLLIPARQPALQQQGVRPLTPTPAGQAPENGTAPAVVWADGMEAGSVAAWETRDCGGEFNTGDGNSVASTDVAHTGRYSAKLTVDTRDGERDATRLMRWCEPTDYAWAYYSAWFYFPQRVQVKAGWWNIFQFKSKTDYANDPFWVVNVGNRDDGTMYLYLRDWMHERSYLQTTKDLPVGRWVHIEAYIHRSDGSDGRITIWQDGTMLFDLSNVQTYYPGGSSTWSVDNYSSGLIPNRTSIYVDDAVISTTRIGDGPLPDCLRTAEAHCTSPG